MLLHSGGKQVKEDYYQLVRFLPIDEKTKNNVKYNKTLAPGSSHCTATYCQIKTWNGL